MNSELEPKRTTRIGYTIPGEGPQELSMTTVDPDWEVSPFTSDGVCSYVSDDPTLPL